MNKETNIISDEDFLAEILNDSKPKVEEQVETKSDIEKILDGEELTKDPVKKVEELKEPTKEESTPDIEEEIQHEEKSTLKRFGVKDTVSSLIENDVWVDMPIKYGEKEYENIEELLEKEKPSKELFELLSVAQKKYREVELDEQYIKVGDKESTKAKLVNAILHDIDYTDLLEYNSEVVQPLQRIDFSSIQDGDRIAEAFVKQCLVEIDNYHPDSIEAVVNKMKEDFSLIEKAEQYQKITIDNFNREIEKREIESKEKLKAQELEIKEDIKALKTVLKEKGINDKFANQILKLRYTKDEKGKFHYENLIKDKMNNKDFQAKFLHFILDEEDFITTQKSKVKTETSKKFLELMNVTPKDKGAKETKNPNNLQTDDMDLFTELGLL